MDFTAVSQSTNHETSPKNYTFIAKGFSFHLSHNLPRLLDFGELSMGKVPNFEWDLALNEFRNTQFSPIQNQIMRSGLVGVYIHLYRTHILH